MSYSIDHRQLADEMEIYFFDEQIGAGLPVWLPNGVAIRDSLESFIKREEQRRGYSRVVSPHLGKQSLYECSGHLRAFRDNMFPPVSWPDSKEDDYLRPMNCPHHHKVFSSRPRSYRDLPLRLAEYGQVYRFEDSGSLRGLVRARGLCQNDAHIYVHPHGAKEEIENVLDLHEKCYAVLGLNGYRYRLSMWDPQQSGNYDGSREEWEEAQRVLRLALESRKLPFFEAVGEAAFYGPKIDVQMRVGSGEEESVASIQLDFNSGRRFDLKFASEKGFVCPWIIHRAPLGSHERFVALLLEYYEGRLPGWLAPVQLYLLPIGDQAAQAAREIAQSCVERGIRVVVDQQAGSLAKRILFAHKYRPFARAVIGANELEKGQLALQFRDGEIVCQLDRIYEALMPLVAVPS